MSREDVIVVGGGVFGLTAALELRARRYAVTLIEPGPLPHPLAASTDISKVVRLEYGADAFYMALMEEARAGWLEWNERWRSEGEDPLYHETGVLMLCRAPMAPGGFEHESFTRLLERGHAPERMDADTIARRFPAWRTGAHVDGFYHRKGGYAESGRVVSALARRARSEGVVLVTGARVEKLVCEGADRGPRTPEARVLGVRASDRSSTREVRADHVVVAAGAWTGMLLPELSMSIRPSGHPVFHVRPDDPAPFRAEVFPTFTADVARTGHYGFPVNPEGIVKIASHALGTSVEADAPRVVGEDEHERLRAFLRGTFPALARADVVHTRLCLYADTQDEDFWIAPDPLRPGLVVSGGGSGHGFKFAPLLGAFTADALESGRGDPRLERFRWRPDVRLDRGTEAARCRGDERSR